MRFQPSRHSYGAVDAPVGGRPTWEQLKTYPVLKKGDADAGNKAGSGGKYLPPAAGGTLYKGLVAEVQRLLGLSTVDGYFGGDTEKAVLAANAKMGDDPVYARYTTGLNPEQVSLATWASLYSIVPVDAPAASTPAAATTSSTPAVTTPGAVAAAPSTGGSPKAGGAAPAKRTGEKVSGRVAARQAKQQSREMWKNIALWGGVAVVGIGAVTLIVKSLGKEGN